MCPTSGATLASAATNKTVHRLSLVVLQKEGKGWGGFEFRSADNCC